MNKKLTLSIFVLSAALVLASCQIPTTPIEEAASSLQAASVQASVVEEIPTATAEPTAVPQPTAVPTAVPPATAGAEQAAQAYFETLRMRDHEAAADLVSEFSLMVFRMTRLDVIDQLMLESAGGMDYTGFEIVESSLLDEQTALVQVKYEGQVEETAPEEAATEEAVTEEAVTEEAATEEAVTEEAVTEEAATEEAATEEAATEGAATEEIVPKKESFEAVWAFRLENGQWKYNWNNLVDFRTLNVQFQTTGGVSMLPKEILRFTDHMQVNLLAQNRTNDPILFGQVNETLATLHFQGKTVEAEPAKIYLNPLRSYPDTTINFAGFYQTYPDTLDIRTWKSYVVNPWYRFDLIY